MSDFYTEYVYRLHKTFERLNKNMSEKDEHKLKTHLMLFRAFRNGKDIDIPEKLFKCDALTFFKFLESAGHVDESNLSFVEDSLRKVCPEISELASMNKRRKGKYLHIVR